MNSRQAVEDEPGIKQDGLEEIHFDHMDVEDAIDQLSMHAAPGPDGIPAIRLITAKAPIARMLNGLFQKSYAFSDVPDDMKLAFITPIHKGGSKTEPANFRPVSLTNHVIKTFERVIRKKMVNYLENNEKMDSNQHGSRSGRSTLSQLLEQQDELLEMLEIGGNADMIYLDFAKAFDKCDHGILLQKMKLLGIKGRLGKWVYSFLNNRKQQVVVRGFKSGTSTVISGVPQGSVLGPILFLIYILDIGTNIETNMKIYVDDSKTKSKIETEDDVEKLQQNLDQLYIWGDKNNMKFNNTKFLVLRFGPNEKLKEETSYFTEDMANIIEQVNYTRDLGITVSDDAKFDQHIDNLCKKVKQRSGWVLRTFCTRSEHFMKTIFKSLIQPHIDYCSQLWMPQQGQKLEKLERLLKSWTSRIPDVRNLNYWERLEKLKMYSEQRRLERYIVIYTWKVLQGFVPNPGIKEAMKNEYLGRRCELPKINHKARKAIQTLKENSFQTNGPNLFNSLPKHKRNMKKCKLEEFKSKLDKYLQLLPDQPKIDDLAPWGQDREGKPSNSILYQVAREPAGRGPGRA